MNDQPNAHPLLAAAPWLRDTATMKVFDVLERAGYQGRAVGGTVRNTLLGEPISDIDMATDATPEQVTLAAQRAGLRVLPTGIAHGTVTIIVKGKPFEVTTLRKDVSTDGRRATVAFTSDWAEDAMRRDFTINALYCDRHGNLFDPVGGLQDIEHRRVRFIGDAHQRIREDYLRILRFFRFSATYANGHLDPVGLAACDIERTGMACLSAERIHHELLRLLAAPHSVPVLKRMSELNFLDDLLACPHNVEAFAALRALQEELSQRYSLEMLPDPVLGLVALAASDRNAVLALRQRLRLSNAETERMAQAREAARMMPATGNGEGIHACIYRHGSRYVEDGLLLNACEAPQRLDLNELAQRISLARTWSPPQMPVSGGDVVARGIPPGPRVAEILKQLEAWWIAQGFPQDRAAIEQHLDHLMMITKT
ncbi:MAG: CCA tRNA nucleotidyltransferase [Hyphomicrobiaceae bacterium]|nr:CCA tRNA nucleotidyltransferase [Hyphomicrobiaceae bacterium]